MKIIQYNVLKTDDRCVKLYRFKTLKNTNYEVYEMYYP